VTNSDTTAAATTTAPAATTTAPAATTTAPAAVVAKDTTVSTAASSSTPSTAATTVADESTDAASSASSITANWDDMEMQRDVAFKIIYFFILFIIATFGLLYAYFKMSKKEQIE
jgi:cobalamin biosynthesis Mg chelatase CobN